MKKVGLWVVTITLGTRALGPWTNFVPLAWLGALLAVAAVSLGGFTLAMPPDVRRDGSPRNDNRPAFNQEVAAFVVGLPIMVVAGLSIAYGVVTGRACPRRCLGLNRLFRACRAAL